VVELVCSLAALHALDCSFSRAGHKMKIDIVV
jgi:hypothetical protein